MTVWSVISTSVIKESNNESKALVIDYSYGNVYAKYNG